MKQAHGWWWPDHELHMLGWMDAPKNKLPLNGRPTYQGKKQVAALRHCKHHRTAIDVGAHIGLWSYNLAHSFAVVHAFEPVAEHRACFEKNMQGVGQFVALHPWAVGKEAGSIAMWTEKGSSGNSQVRGSGEIPLVTIDSMHFENVDFIKVDCETIVRCKPTIIVEQKRDMASRFDLPILGAVDFLKTLGYKVAEEISGDYIMVPT
jgi:FkbM family methyltransferase